MKRFFMVIALCVMTFWSAQTSEARGFGVTGGASFLDIKSIGSGSFTGYHAGITYKFDLPFGFAVQPSVLYHMKGSVVEEAYNNGSSLDLKTGYIEVPVSIQWGPDLILFRPFFDVAPFVGYGLNNSIAGDSLVADNHWNGLNRLEYGLGLGLGIDVWQLQIIGRYNWNFGSMFDVDGHLISGNEALANVKSSILDGNNYSGMTLTVSFMF